MRSINGNFGATLKKIVAEAIACADVANDCDSVWLFGSSISTSTPADIDILYVYRIEKEASTARAITFRREFSRLTKLVFGMPADVILFSTEEARTNPFIEEEGCIRIWPHKTDALDGAAVEGIANNGAGNPLRQTRQ